MSLQKEKEEILEENENGEFEAAAKVALSPKNKRTKKGQLGGRDDESLDVEMKVKKKGNDITNHEKLTSTNPQNDKAKCKSDIMLHL